MAETALELKQKGNNAFSAGNFEEAVSHFTAAINLEPVNEVLYCNRSMAYSSLEEWELSVNDAKTAVQLQSKYEKAYFRLVKGLIQLERFKEARIYLTVGFNECGDSKHLKSLESLIIEKTGIPIRPKPQDFDNFEELGDGNFSKIVKCEYKPTKQVYAIKTIEKQTIERMKRRHPNINNEILIEKRTLNKLDHPNIVILFSTFQDYGTLYYQMEYLGGGEVWSRLQDDRGGGHASVGCYVSLARYYMAEAINALEYMHRKGIVHRDVKPENMLIAANGRMKFVDFGTCKDMIQKDLNGQEFVGTAEYMSPEVVESEESGPETDLWSLGVTFYQMLTGYTAFAAASPYLSFLRIKRGFIRYPCFASQSIKELLSALIQKNKKKRLQTAATMVTNGPSKVLSYDNLRNMAFFTEDHFQFPDPYSEEQIVKVPKLSELCLRAVGAACHVVAEKMSLNGGSKSGLEEWIQKFDLSQLNTPTRLQLMHYLNRRQDLHGPAVYRLFWPSVVDARTIRTDWTELGYFGFDRHTQGHFTDPFFFVYFLNPLFGFSSGTSLGGESTWDEELKNLRGAISAVNKLRPRFVVVGGNFVSAVRDADSESAGRVDAHTMQTEAVRRCFARISETIPVLFVPGPVDVGPSPTPASIARYHSLYGSDFFGFWYGGVRVLVINSTAMLHPENIPEHAALQDTWFDEELQQCKLCAAHIVVFSHHAWFHEHAEESLGQGDASLEGYMSRSLRDKWLPKMRHEKVKFVFCGDSANVRGEGSVRRPYLHVRGEKSKHKKEDDTAEMEVTSGDGNEALLAVSGVEGGDTCDGEEKARDWKELPEGVTADYSDTDSGDDDGDEGGDTGEGTKKERKDGQDSLFAPDMKYNGPVQVIVPAVGLTSTAEGGSSKCVCVIEVRGDEDMVQTSYELAAVPTRNELAL